MRLVLACSLLLAPAFAFAADIEFVRVWPGWREAESFERIAEYFGRGERTSGRETVLRTQPERRAGYYFLVRIKSATAVPGATLQLSVIRPDAPDPKVYRFPTTTALPTKEAVYQLGLTGSDWPEGEKANPVAWKIAILNQEGRVLAEHKSFLWEKPAK